MRTRGDRKVMKDKQQEDEADKLNKDISSKSLMKRRTRMKRKRAGTSSRKMRKRGQTRTSSKWKLRNKRRRTISRKIKNKDNEQSNR